MRQVLIKDTPKAERPRERLEQYGVSNLSNEELIAIILKTGTKNESVKSLAARLLITIGGVTELKDTKITTLTSIKGIGKVKAMELIAAIELGKRIYYDKELTNNTFNNAESVFNYFRYYLNNKKQEHFYCLYLDNKKNLIDKKLLFVGTINKSIVHPREIFKEAYLLSASYIICVHNHPSNDPTPSNEDLIFTKSIIEIGAIQGIPIIDHIIVGNNNYYSFFEQNKI
ncbi:MAG: DNA repair protein RadC [Bacilli bacterium]|nr:DNA repair protein RadC [Bacilli bacterium]